MTRTAIDEMGPNAGADNPNVPPLRVRTSAPSLSPRSRSLGRAFYSVATLLLVVGAAGCDPGFPSSEGTARIDQETFIETYVELRLAVLTQGQLSEAERDRILAEQGVTEEDLRRFIEVHGRNVPYMNRIWLEIDHRITEARGGDPTEPGPGAMPGLPVPPESIPPPGPIDRNTGETEVPRAGPSFQ